MILKWHSTILLGGILATIYLIFILLSDSSTIWENFLKINPWNFFLAFVLWSISNFLRAIRWHIFVRSIVKIPFLKNLILYFSGFAFLITPARMGEIIKSYYLKRDYDLPVSKTAPIVLIERFYDLAGIVSIVLISFALLESQLHVLLLFPLFGVFMFTLNRKSLVDSTLKKLFKFKYLAKYAPNIDESVKTIQQITTLKCSLIGILFSIVITGLQSIAVYFLITSFVPINLEKVFLIFPLSNFLAAITLIPGGIGVFEGGFIGLLVQNQINYDIAVTVSVLIRIIGTGFFTVLGMILLKKLSK